MKVVLLLAALYACFIFLGCEGDPSGPSGSAAVYGMLWLDADANGHQAGGEDRGIIGVTIRLTDDRGRVTSCVTGGDGRFRFDDLKQGNYTVELDTDTLPAILPPTTGTVLTLTVEKNQQSESLFGAGFAPPGTVPLRFLAVGDSITRGQGSSDEQGYPRLLQNRLSELLGSFDMINCGVDGSTAMEGLTFIDAFLSEHRPTYVLILYGILDCINPQTWEAFLAAHVENRLLALVDAVRATGAMPVLATITPVNPEGRLAPAKERIDYVNNQLRVLAAARGVLLADINAAMEAVDDLPGLFVDWGHPNDAGYTIIAETWYETLTGPAIAPCSRSGPLPALQYAFPHSAIRSVAQKPQ